MDDQAGGCPVQWHGDQAVVTLPEQMDVSNAGQIREELLWVINRGAPALVGIAQLIVVLDVTVMNIALPGRAGRAALQHGGPAVGGHGLHPGVRQPAPARRQMSEAGRKRPS